MASPSSSPVSLRVYDLSRGMARQLSPALLGKQIDGIWHTGVLVYGNEYFYGGGIQVMAPELVVARYGMPPVQVVPLGTTRVPRERFEQFLREISPRFTAATYDLLANNCNNFSDELARFLLDGAGIPQHILDLPNEALSTPLGAMLRPMIENMQREMNATGAQPFAIPFNDPSRATAPVPSATTTATSSTASSSSPAHSPQRFKVTTNPALHLERIVARVAELNALESSPPLSHAQLAALQSFATRVVQQSPPASTISTNSTNSTTTIDCDAAAAAELWDAALALLARGPESALFFPALGVARALLLALPAASARALEAPHAAVDAVLRAAERGDRRLPDAHAVAALAVLVNASAGAGASDLVLARALRLLPVAFAAAADAARAPAARELGASLVANCCLALEIEEEAVITTAVCGAVETLERLARERAQSAVVAGVAAGVASLARNFPHARSLSSELGLRDVLLQLRASDALSSVRPLLSELEALIGASA